MASRRKKRSPMDGRAFLELVRAVAAKLEARKDIFEVGELSVGAPLTEDELVAIEQQLGVRLPAVLRSVYLEASSISFAWSIRRGEEDRLGYENEEGPVGYLELVAAKRLHEEWTPARSGARALCITGDGHGDGFALAFDGSSEPAVVWYTHDDSPAFRPAQSSVSEWLVDWASTGFVNHGDTDRIEAFLAKGKTQKVERDRPSKLRPVLPSTRKRKSALLATPSLAALGDGVVDLTKHREQVFAFAPLTDGARCVSGSNDGALHISDLRTGRLLQKLRHGGHIQCIAVHPNGRDFISGGWSDYVVWNLETGEGRRPEGDSHHTNQAVIHPDGERLLTLGGYSELKIWSLTTGKLLATYRDDHSCLALDHAGRAITMGTPHKQPTALRIWDIEAGACLHEMRHPDLPQTRGADLVLDREGRRALFVQAPSEVVAFDLETGTMARAPIAAPNAYTQSPAVLAPDGESILFGTMEGGLTLRCVRIADGTTVFEYLVGPLGAPMLLSMTLDGTRVLCGLSSGVALVLPYAALAERRP